MSDQYFSPTPGMPNTPVFELSGWWRRVGALVIDSLLLSIPILIVGIVAALSLANSNDFESAEDFGPGTGIFLVLILVGAIVLPAVYYCWIMPKTNGQTWGKQATGIRVVREDGQKITAGFAFIREILVISLLFNLIGGIFLFNLPILVDYLWPLWDSKNQALHDKIVKSRVIRVTANVMVQPGSPSFPVGYPAEPTAPPTPTATPVPYVPPGQRYVAPQPPPAVHDPQQPVPPPPAAPPAQPTAPPPPPQPGGTSTPYTPPPGFDNPVPDEDDK